MLSPQALQIPVPRTHASIASPRSYMSGVLTPPNEDFNQFLIDSRSSRRTSEISDKFLVNPVVVAVVGVGYVGFQLVQSFSQHYPVIAYDVSKSRVQELRQHFAASTVYTTNNPTHITHATHVLIAVPTRVHEHDKSIDTSHLETAINILEKYARSGTVVVVESSVAVGMTRDLLEPLQRSKNFKVGMSPERVDPGRKDIAFEAIPKVVSGLDLESLQAIEALYTPIFHKVVPVSSCEVAEMTKLYENCQRMIGIAYANEMSDACETIGIDPAEVCSAAATKPFGYQSYLPSAGVGGHCIPVNPYYLLSNMQFPLLESATEKMRRRPALLAERVMASLSQAGKSSRAMAENTTYETKWMDSTRVLIVGVAFKPGQSVTSHSPGLAMIEYLTNSTHDVHVDFCDPFVSMDNMHGAFKIDHERHWNPETLDNSYDAVIVTIPQLDLDFDVLRQLRRTKVFDFTSVLKKL